MPRKDQRGASRSRGGRQRRDAREAPRSPRERGEPSPATRKRAFPVVALVCVALGLATAAVYGQMAFHDFIVLDDNTYIYDNPRVATGLNPANVAWAFQAFHSNNWHPVTWLSHMLDVQLFGLRSGPHHLVNAILHMVNGILVFLLLRRLTGAMWRSAFVAAAFVLHPMHVESVAWASERKDVLSTMFGLLTIWAYVSYARRPHLARYAVVIGVFALGLMSKPMLVTLPFVLLLLDYWPLQRWSGAPDAPARGPIRGPARNWSMLLVEKLPLVAMVAASSVLTLTAQARGGVVRSLEDVSLAMRATNALASYVRYIDKLLLPVQQAFYYPYPRELPLIEAAVAVLALVTITYAFWRLRHERPYPLVGWLWFLGTLVPVIGLVQVATQALADRYAYIPSVGLFLVVAWGAVDVGRRWPQRKALLGILAGIVLAGYGVKAWAQARNWRDSVTLFTHDTQVIPQNGMAYRNLGVAYHRIGRYDEAIAALDKAIEIYPHEMETLLIMSACYVMQGKPVEAEERIREAVAHHPGRAKARFRLGGLLNSMGRPTEAIPEFEAAIRLQPDYAEAYNNLGNALGKVGRMDEAITRFHESIRLDPSSAEAYTNLGSTLHKLGRNPEALEQYARAIRINPRLAAAHYNAAVIHLETGDTAQAMTGFGEAARLNPRIIDPFQVR